MSHLLNKSEQNKSIALFLYTDAPTHCYAASMHCSYYSCLQKIMYILKDFFDDRYLKINKDVKGRTGNIHKDYFYEIDSIIQEFSEKSRAKKNKDGIDIKNFLIDLRDLRIEADYHDVEIGKVKAEKAYKYAVKIHHIIKQHLNQ